MPLLSTNDDFKIVSLPGLNSHLSMSTVRGEAYKAEGKNNQDCVASFSAGEVTVDIVCDGLGGYADQNGELAARLCCEEAEKIVEQGFEKMTPEEIPSYFLKKLLQQTTVRYAQENLGPQAGTTLLLMITIASQITVYHLGDSRAMFFTPDGAFVLQTVDHKSAEFLHRFKLTRYVYKTDPKELTAQADEWKVDLKNYPQGLIAVLMSDGITDNLKTSVDEPECTTALSELIKIHRDAESLCATIMKQANEHMALKGTPEGEQLDVKPDNSACLVRWFRKNLISQP